MEVIQDVFSEEVASKSDLAKLRIDFREMLHSELHSFKKEFKAEVKEMIEREFRITRYMLLIQMGAIIVGVATYLSKL